MFEPCMTKLLDAPQWRSAGPSPIGVNGSSFTGAIQSVVGQKTTTNPDTYVLFAGAVNSGVWRLEAFRLRGCAG